MNMREKYYRERLYPLQDGVLNIVKKSGTPFYLTGGTALSRLYLNHRYSDDLDLFVNSDNNYAEYINILIRHLKEAEKKDVFQLDERKIYKTEFYSQIFIKKEYKEESVDLKIDVVNDIAKHYGEFHFDNILGKVDSWENILSNKLTAIFRQEPKDLFDIWALSKKYSFSWDSIIKEAKTKEAGIDPIILKNILSSFPIEFLSKVKQITIINPDTFLKDLDIISEDIFTGNENSLYIK
jgi:hypothetical protein